MLTQKEFKRYDRQIRIENFGVKAQEKLKEAKVVIAGVGGLGCTASTYLAVAGVGEIVLVDREKVEFSNLNRQVLHWEKDVGKFKVYSAAKKLRKLNSNVKVRELVGEINNKNVYRFIKNADVVVDGLDNFKTRFLLNKACMELGIPFVHAAIHGLIGELMTIIPGKGPCYQCYIVKELKEIKPTPALGATAGVIGCLEAIEVIKLMAEVGEPLVGKLLLFNGGTMEFTTLEIKRLKNCPACGKL
ncbi:MAG: HesA/MoeB/ThiF family protein [Candidatus Bathyarchaeota archaeon]|nr:HesA/MoeB/ThiF family protein [Candidatus Bathyarchaeota archaeon]